MKKLLNSPWRQEALIGLTAHLNNFLEQKPALFTLLSAAMEEEVSDQKDDFLCKPNRVMNKSYYVHHGYVVVSQETEKGRQVARIYGRDTIISSRSFDSREASDLFFEPAIGTQLLTVSYELMQQVYTTFPETQELSRLITGYWNEEAIKRLAFLNQDGAAKVEQFYRDNQELLAWRKIISDEKVASYLLISVSALRLARTALLKSGKLKRPEKGLV